MGRAWAEGVGGAWASILLEDEAGGHFTHNIVCANQVGWMETRGRGRCWTACPYAKAVRAPAARGLTPPLQDNSLPLQRGAERLLVQGRPISAPVPLPVPDIGTCTCTGYA